MVWTISASEIKHSYMTVKILSMNDELNIGGSTSGSELNLASNNIWNEIIFVLFFLFHCVYVCVQIQYIHFQRTATFILVNLSHPSQSSDCTWCKKKIDNFRETQYVHFSKLEYKKCF